MFPEVVDLNVGGVFYTVSLSTLTKISGTYLADMFAAKGRPVKDAHGRYFIDRDGVLFRYILEYLRDGEIRLPENFQEKDRLRHEAHCYRLGNILANSIPPTDLPNGDRDGACTANHANVSRATASLTDVRASVAARGVITVGYRGTFAFGREGTAEVKFRKLTRILICGRVSLCREVFGETLNESRDPDRGSDDRYTARFFLKHSYLEQAFDMLLDRGFQLVGCCGTGTNSAGNGISESGGTLQPKTSVDSEESRWNHYNEFVWLRGSV